LGSFLRAFISQTKITQSLNVTYEFNLPQTVVARQLDACNAKDIDAWLATSATSAVQYELEGKVFAAGQAEIRSR